MREAERVSLFDKWMSGDEAKISRSMKGEKREEGRTLIRAGAAPGGGWGGQEAGLGDRGRKGEGRGTRGRRQKKKDSLSVVFCQGRNYTFTEVFSSNDGLHRSSRWIYEPISNMKYRH